MENATLYVLRSKHPLIEVGFSVMSFKYRPFLTEIDREK